MKSDAKSDIRMCLGTILEAPEGRTRITAFGIQVSRQTTANG